MKIRTLLGSLLICTVIAGCGTTPDTAGTQTGPSPSTSTITGAGSTFVNPAMSKWTYAFDDANKGVTINYQSVGSGAGIGQLKAGTVDFAASDVAMGDKDL